MKALTLWQPWASLIALGEKRIETRCWQTSYRGPLAIHAAKKLPPRWTVVGALAKLGFARTTLYENLETVARMGFLVHEGKLYRATGRKVSVARG